MVPSDGSAQDLDPNKVPAFAGRGGRRAIVVTRPRAQAQHTATLLQQSGWQVTLFPVLAVEAKPTDAVAAAWNPDWLKEAFAVVFVSTNAVEFGVPWVRRGGGVATGATLFAIGEATAAALRAAGLKDIDGAPAQVVTPSDGNDSEALLRLPALQNVKGRTILVVRGHSESGGRVALTQTLQARGARVETLECYQRAPATPAPDEQAALRSALLADAVEGFLILSGETLESLVSQLERLQVGKKWQACTAWVSHARVAAMAQAAGFNEVRVVAMGDAALPAALMAQSVSKVVGQES